MNNSKPEVGAHIGELSFPMASGDGEITIGQSKDRWTVLFVYRGALTTLQTFSE